MRAKRRPKVDDVVTIDGYPDSIRCVVRAVRGDVVLVDVLQDGRAGSTLTDIPYGIDEVRVVRSRAA